MREDERQLQRLAEGSCRYNDHVQCEDAWRPSKCVGCGWNPKVDAERKRRREREHGR